MYALKLAEDGRILSIMDERYQTAETPLVEDYPQEVKDGDAYQYRYVDGEWIYDPLPKPTTVQEDTDAMLIDHEYRLTLLELGLFE